MDKSKIISQGTYEDLFAKHPEIFEKILKQDKEK
jgi:hypothetical protein